MDQHDQQRPTLTKAKSQSCRSSSSIRITSPNIPQWTPNSPDPCYPPRKRSWHPTLTPTGCLGLDAIKQNQLRKE